MPDLARKRIRELYGFEFPDDFFQFREFLKSLPRKLLSEVVAWNPVFPFTVADGKKPATHPKHPLWEDRYYNDPPEFITLFHGQCDGQHWGYHFDDPGRAPPVVASYYSRDAYEYSIDGDDLFHALRAEVESSYVGFLENEEYEPEETEYYAKMFAGLDKLRDALSRVWKDDRPEVGDEYLDLYGGTDRVPTAETWDRMGIVVPAKQYKPITKKWLVRRPGLVEPNEKDIPQATEAALKRIEEGFPGVALQMGRELWVFSEQFETSYRLLDTAYEALGRDPLRGLLQTAQEWRVHCDKK